MSQRGTPPVCGTQPVLRHPEAVYFAAREGKRGGVMIVDLPDASKIPAIAEPFSLRFQATVAIHPCMTPQDLANAGLDQLGQKRG